MRPGSYVNSHHLSHAGAFKGVSHRCSICGLAWITIPNNDLQDVGQKTPKWVQAELYRALIPSALVVEGGFVACPGSRMSRGDLKTADMHFPGPPPLVSRGSW